MNTSPPKNKARIALITQKLQAALNPSTLVVEDESHQHIGHAGAKTGLGHFHIIISAEQFKGQPSIACHRMIYQALGDLMQTDIHAVRISLKA